MFKFTDGIGGHAFEVFGLDLYLFDGNELGGVGGEVAEVDICVGSFS